MAVSIWTGVGLLGDLLILPLLKRVRGIDYLRWSVLIELGLFPLFLLTPSLVWKLVLLGLLGMFNSGWYAILSAQLYDRAPGSSGTLLTLGNLSGLAGRLLPLVVGWAAQAYGLQHAIWLLLLGPLVLLFGIPRRTNAAAQPG